MLGVLGNLAWVGANFAGRRRFERAVGDCEGAQRDLLLRYLADNAQTAYGRAHGFHELRDAEEYRDRVPAVTYDDLEPWVDRVATGEADVLTHEPVLLFEPSSGSTRAAKRIPYTAGLQAEIRGAVAPWMWDLYTRWPALLGGPAYWSITPVARRDPGEAGAVPVGFEEDSAYLGGIFKGLLDRVLAVPGGVRRVHDVATFRRVTLLFLLGRPDLRLISVWHPTFLLSLLDRLAASWDDLLADLAAGYAVPGADLAVPAAPARARALRDADPRDVRALWPDLALVSCWGDAHARPAADALRARLPGVTVQGKGLIATEGFVTIPYRDRPVLAVSSHFYEFADDAGGSRFAWELADGAEYSVMLTTAGGLYRYRLRDRVRVRGFYESTPCLEFVGKEDQVSDLRGEKLSAGFVGAVLAAVLPARPAPPFAMLAPELDADPPGYVLYLGGDAAPRDLGAALERGLRENPHYAYAVDLGQLAPARVVAVGGRGYERYSDRLVAEGRRLGDIKPTPLSARGGWGAVFGDPGGAR